MANTLAQNPTVASFANASSVNKTFASACTNGSLVVASVSDDIGNTITVTDDGTGSYNTDATILQNDAGVTGGGRVVIASKQNTNTSALTVTATMGAAGYGALKLYELAGQATSSVVDVAVTAKNSFGPSVSIGVTTSTPNCTVIEHSVHYHGGLSTVDSGFTSGWTEFVGSNAYHWGEYRLDAGGAATFTLTEGGNTTIGDNQWGGCVVAYKTAGGAPPPPEDVARKEQQAATHARPYVSPQAIKAGIAALLPVVIGPTVPQGNPASSQVQALAAYRPSSQPTPQACALFTQGAVAVSLPVGPMSTQQALAAYRGPAQPTPQARPIITQGGAAAAPYMPTGANDVTGPSSPWPYASFTLPPTSTASAWGIPDADLIFDRLWPLIVQVPAVAPTVAIDASLPYGFAALLPVASQVPRVVVPPPLASAWPYAATEQWRLYPEPAPAAGITVAYVGPQTIPAVPPVRWPYAYVQRAPLAQIAAAGVALPTVVPQLPQAPWPYAQVEQWRALPEPAAFGGITAVYLAPQPGPQPIPTAWPYAAAQQAPLAPIPTPLSNVAPAVTWQIPTTLWPHAPLEQWRLAPEPAAFGAITAVYLAPAPIPAATVAPWPYALLQGVAFAPIAGPVTFLGAPGVTVPTSVGWPYVATLRLPTPPIASPAALLAAPAPQQPAAAPWPYVSATLPTPITFGLAPAFLSPSPVWQFTQQRWPYVATQPEPTTALPVQQLSAPALSPAILPQQRTWVHALLPTIQPTPVVTQGGLAGPFEFGNLRVWQPSARSRAWYVDARTRFWYAPPRARVWRVTVWKVGSHMSTNEKRLSESVLYDFDCSLLLAPGETISGTPAVTAEPTTSPALSIGTPAVNTQPITYADGHTAPIGQVIQVRLGAGAIATGQLTQTYLMRAKFPTNLNPNVEANGYLRVNDTPAA